MLGRTSDIVGIPYIIIGVVEHLGLIVPLVDNSMGERASSRVVPAVSTVDFLHHIPGLLRTETSQIRVGWRLE